MIILIHGHRELISVLHPLLDQLLESCLLLLEIAECL